MIADGLATTAEQWPAIRIAFGWLHQAAQLLNNASERGIGSLRRAYRRLLATIRQGAPRVGLLEPAVRHFLKVTASYWPGLFVCYHRPDIPRTNNDLEHVFGSVRYHERRASGRKVAAPTFLVRSSVRLLAAASQQQAFTSADLQPKISTTGAPYARSSPNATQPVRSSVGFGRTRSPTWPMLNASSTRKVCRPSFF